MPWEETDDYIRSGHQESSKFDADSLRTVTISEEEGIRAVTGCPKGQWSGGSCQVGVQVQSYLFSKEKGWTMEKAKEWFEKHKEGIIEQGPRTDEERAKAHFNISDEDWDKLSEEEKKAYIEKLPSRGSAESSVRVYLFAEAIKLAGNRVSGVAIHPKRLWHPEEGETHVFLRDELKKSAPTLSGKPFGVDHLRLLPIPNVVEKAWFDEQANGVAFEGTVDDEIAQKIKEGAFKGLSIELNWFKPGVMMEKVNGIAPRNFEFTSVHLMSRFPPADRDTFIKVWEGITLPVVPPPLDIQIDQLRQMFEERLSYLEGQVAAFTKSEPFMQAPAPAIIIFKEAEAKFGAEIKNLREALSGFDGLKQAYGKEKHEAEATFVKKAATLADKIREYTVGIDELNKRLKDYKPEGETVVNLRKQLFEAQANLDKVEKEKKESDRDFRLKYNALHSAVLEAIPPPQIWLAWKAGGPKVMVQKVLNALGVKPEEYFS